MASCLHSGSELLPFRQAEAIKSPQPELSQVNNAEHSAYVRQALLCNRAQFSFAEALSCLLLEGR